MNSIEIEGKNYTARGFDDLTGADWKRIALNLEWAASAPDEIFRALRGIVTIAIPSVSKDARAWTDLQTLGAFQSAMEHLTKELKVGGELHTTRLPAALTAAMVSIQAVCATRENK